MNLSKPQRQLLINLYPNGQLIVTFSRLNYRVTRAVINSNPVNANTATWFNGSVYSKDIGSLPHNPVFADVHYLGLSDAGLELAKTLIQEPKV